MAEGVDVSKWQGSINWSSVKSAGKSFAVARSSVGSSTADATFISNYKNIVQAGLIPGAYHLVTATSSGVEQAANWKGQLDAAGFDKGLLVLDVEGWSETTSQPPSATLAVVEHLCNWIRDTYNRTPIIYTGVFWREYLKQHPDNFGSLLWLAAYVTDPTPYVPHAWDTWKIWQYSSSGSVAGVSGNVDLDKSAGTIKSLKALAGWEWDELATKEEIQALVAVEADRVISQLSTVSATSSDEIKAAVNDVLTAVSNQVKPLGEAETREKLVDILDAIESMSNEDVKTAVNVLHTHVCNRVDLHQ